MINPFEFFGIARIVFGCGAFSRAAELSASLGRRPMIIHNGPAEPLLEKLAGVEFTICRQRGEPLVADIDRAVDQARQGNCDSVIGFGGGSAIDAAKAVAGILGNGGSVVDYMEVVGNGKKIAKPALPWMAIPTTAGTGAEATRNAVVGYPEKKFKASLRSEYLLARIALIDPAAAVNVPPAITASCGMDALCQLIESYTSTGASPMTDALALRGISLAAKFLPRAFADGKDLNAREAMALAALLSGISLAGAGLGAVHGFASPLGANFPIPHGTICAALLPGVILANVKNLRAAGSPALIRYADIGRLLGGAQCDSDAAAIDRCISFTRDLARDLKIPPLNVFGFKRDHVMEMIPLARKASSMKFNPCILSDEALAEILCAAFRK